MVAKDFHTRFRVGVKGRFETQLRDTNLFEKGFNGTNQITQTQIVIGHQTLHLMEFTQMRGIHRFIAKDPVNGKVFGGLKATLLIGKFVQHLRRDGRRVGAQQILHGFLAFKVIPVPNRTSTTNLVHALDAFVVFLGDTDSRTWFFNEKSIVGITSRMRLGLKEGIEIPETGFHPLVGGHFRKAHFHENFSKFRADLEQGMKVSATDLLADSSKVVGFEGRRLPSAAVQHFLGNVSGFLDTDGGETGALGDFEGFASDEVDELAFL
mmetsp:Transcript_31894/g.52616  ORF Transcript_31894/g.52616 Transcript_31894/m.52616 type:complete len:266 (-) Transcript_31894:602-1399(-)